MYASYNRRVFDYLTLDSISTKESTQGKLIVLRIPTNSEKTVGVLTAHKPFDCIANCETKPKTIPVNANANQEESVKASRYNFIDECDLIRPINAKKAIGVMGNKFVSLKVPNYASQADYNANRSSFPAGYQAHSS